MFSDGILCVTNLSMSTGECWTKSITKHSNQKRRSSLIQVNVQVYHIFICIFGVIPEVRWTCRRNQNMRSILVKNEIDRINSFNSSLCYFYWKQDKFWNEKRKHKRIGSGRCCGLCGLVRSVWCQNNKAFCVCCTDTGFGDLLGIFHALSAFYLEFRFCFGAILLFADMLLLAVSCTFGYFCAMRASILSFFHFCQRLPENVWRLCKSLIKKYFVFTQFWN